MSKKNVQFDYEHDPARLDRVLVERFPEYSRSFLKDLIAKGRVRVNRAPVSKAGHKVQSGDGVWISFPEEVERTDAGVGVALDILFEDEHTLVINKPVGVVVHRAPSVTADTPSVVDSLLHTYPGVFSIKNTERPGIVHRLDKDTTGALLIAKHDKALEYYSSLFAERDITKIYYCITHGVFPHKHAKIEAPIGRSEANRVAMTVSRKGKAATTEFFLEDSTKAHSLLKVQLHTGRTHQIRVHLTSVEHPIVGDERYGKRGDKDAMMLHARSLSFVPFQAQSAMMVVAPFPETMKEFAKDHSLHLPHDQAV